MKNIFDAAVTSELINRINKLTPETERLWGKMSVSHMLAHCNVTYELVFTDKHPKPNFIAKFMIKLLAKPLVVGEKPYKKNGRTAPVFLVKGQKDFESEKQRLINHLNQVQALGASHFDGKESHAMGNLTSQEWNNMFYKHLDHHLSQFGV